MDSKLPFTVIWEILDVGMADGLLSWRLMALRYDNHRGPGKSLLNISYEFALKQLGVVVNTNNRYISNFYQSTFNNNANYWTNKDPYNLVGGQTGFDSQETKLPTYWDTSFTKICLGMKIGSQKRFTLINKQASSFHSLIAQGQYHATSLGRNTWKWLIGSQSSMQHSCNKEGFNVAAGENNEQKIRIGIFANQEDDCATPDSKIGFGMGGSSSTNTCGNVANGKFSPDNGDKNIRAIGYILVQ